MAQKLRAGVVWANTYNKFDPTSPVRRIQGSGLRPRGRRARASRPYVSAVMTSRLNVRKTYKLYINGEFPRTESGRFYAVTGKGGELLANACRGSRKDLRNAVAAARKAFSRLERQDRVQPRPDPLSHRGSLRGARRRSWRTSCAGRARPPPKRARKSRASSTAGSTTPAGATNTRSSSAP